LDYSNVTFILKRTVFIDMKIQLMSRYGEEKSVRDTQQKRNKRGEKDNNQS